MPPVQRLPSPRLRPRTLALGLAGVALMCGFSGRASAQAEAETPAPNVLLLVDNSGSMEFKVDGEFPQCVPSDLTVQQKSRWIELVEVLTGRFRNYSCWAQDRSTPEFRDEFSIGSVVPYDFGYVNPYHRALSSNCLVGPGVLPSPNAFEFPDKGVNTFTLGAGNVVARPAIGLLPSHPGCAGFAQLEDGLLDVFKNSVRFGLMTFDARVNKGQGYTGLSTPDYPTGMDGNWSYYLPGAPATGHPANCSFDVDHEVGARNGAAPPWEGRMIAFGQPTATNGAQRNAWIQDTLLATRPYGATPINGQLYDARDFLFRENRSDPLTPSDPLLMYGPKDDVLWHAPDCRKTIVILLTDGEPNLDLRPYCDQQPPPPETGGRCPYIEPSADVVRSMRLSPPRASMSVETYVVGFAMGTVTPFNAPPVKCNEVTDPQCKLPENNDFENYPEGKRVQACCRLNEIAAAGRPVDSQGNPPEAFFAESGDDLRSIFNGILSGIVKGATRTMPVLEPVGDAASKGFKFTSSFVTQPPADDPNVKSALWAGQLNRHRFVCSSTTLEAAPAPLDPNRGDDFALNLNTNGGSRKFFTVVGAGGIGSNLKSIRNEVFVNDDGIGLSSGDLKRADSPGALAGEIPSTAMDLVSNTSCTGISADACRDRVINHLVGQPNDEGKSRCYSGGCRLMGAIFHSTPTVVPGKPSEFLRDESYDDFVSTMAAELRRTVLYTSTVDGMLHAFDVSPHPAHPNPLSVSVKDSSLNELWAFLPPAVLPRLRGQYPDLPTVLLDGVPVVKDVVSRTTGVTTRFERLQTEAFAGRGDWSTVLVQGFGEGEVDGGYFALDVTRPELATGDGPRFLWQLTRNTADANLFGKGGTPLITTVYLQKGTDPPKEVAVAVLPGGNLGPDNGALVPTGLLPALDVKPTGFSTLRTTGQNYASSERARSLTIVRLDTGEVVRTFRANGAGFDPGVFTSTNIPAPITGQPAAFPGNTGAVADRIFVGDRDGRMWRVDVSSKNPANWRMKVFFDAFYDNEPSQPVMLPPVLSTDDDGRVTVAFATGDQEVKTAPSTMLNRVVSLTERLEPLTNAFEAQVNWIHDLTDAYRVTGNMSLYSKALYYAVSQPPAASGLTCNRGSAQVFGAHYLKPQTANAPEDGPAPAPSRATLLMDKREPGMIFGLSVQPDPTCTSVSSTVGGDDSFGYGSIDMPGRANEGRRWLAYSVSGVTSASDGSGSGSGSGSATTTTTVNTGGIGEVKVLLESPSIPVTFESWGLLYE